MRRSCQFHRLLALQPQEVEHHQQTYWQVLTLLSSVPRLSKLASQLVKERSTQNRRPRVHEVRQLGVVTQPMEGPNA